MSLALLTFGRDSEENPSPSSNTPPVYPFSHLKSSLKSPRERRKRSSTKKSYVVDLKPSHVPLSVSPSTSNSSNSTMTTKRRQNSNVMSPAVTRAVRGSRGRRVSTSNDVLGSFGSSENDALNTPLWSTSQFDDLFVGETKHFSPDVSARDGNKIINTSSTITL